MPASDLGALAGAVLCVGLPGPSLDDALRARLAALRPGALVLFARNVTTPSATRALVADAIAAIAPALPLAVAIDQEGGRVTRVAADVPMPAMLALGATDDAALARRAGAALAAQVRAVGANVAFAPVLDLALDARSTVVGTRALGDDPARVAALGAALVAGFADGGVVATPKHFPGHGATPEDSHVGFPVVRASLATLRERDWIPYRAAFAAGARAVMTAHVVVAELGDEPATLSARALREILRDELGFAGACFTDCLEMAAIAKRYGTVAGGVRALAAGADALVVSADLTAAEALRVAIVAAVRDGSLPEARLRDAVARCATLRRGLAPHDAPYATDDGAAARAVAAAAIVVVRGVPQLVAGDAATVVSFEGSLADGAGALVARAPLHLALRRRRVRGEAFAVPLDPDAATVAALRDAVVAYGSRALVILARRARRFAGQRAALDALLAVAPDAIVVSMAEPFDVACVPRARHVVCAFGDDATTVDALAAVLVGAVRATGRLPVSLEAPVAP